MQKTTLTQKISFTYLSLVPFLTALSGFTVHNVSYKIYLPLWILNIFLMAVASWTLSGNVIKEKNTINMHLAAGGVLLVSPWMLYSIFAGMGSPPSTNKEWVDSVFEQQVRYSFLIMGGILMTFGFAVVREKTKEVSGNIYSLIGFTAIVIAMILFILNMSFWHSFLPETFKIAIATSLKEMPDWYLPVKKMFSVISIAEVSLTYFATAAFAASLQSAGWFKKGASYIYIVISLLAFFLVACYGLYSDNILSAGFPFYPFMIPAIPFTLPYFIGVNLLRRAGI